MSFSKSCTVCNSRNFECINGLYYCTVCYSQCKFLVKEEYDEDVADLQNTGIYETSKSVDHVYEAFTVILSKIADFLVNQGASASFKAILLRFWLTLVRCASVSEKTVSRENRNGSKHLETKKAKLDIDVNQSDIKVLKKSIDDIEFNPTKKNLSHIFTSTPVNNKKFNRSALKKIYGNDFMKRLHKDEVEDYNSNNWNLFEMFRSKSWNFTISSIIALIYLVLLIEKESIELFDIIRWIREGHLPYFGILNYLPYSLQQKVKTFKCFATTLNPPTAHSLRMECARIASILNIKTLPQKNLHPIVSKLAACLQLPDNIIKLIHNLMVMYPSILDQNIYLYDAKSTCSLPLYESRAMAYIIVVLKLLFGIDDTTERNLSAYYRLINLTSDTKYFVWEDWLSYIMLRHIVVKLLHPGLLTTENNSIQLFSPDIDSLCNYFLSTGASQIYNPNKPENYNTKTLSDILGELGLNKSNSSTVKVMAFKPSELPDLSIFLEAKESGDLSRFIFNERGLKILHTDFSRHHFDPLRMKSCRMKHLKIEPLIIQKIKTSDIRTLRQNINVSISSEEKLSIKNDTKSEQKDSQFSITNKKSILSPWSHYWVCQNPVMLYKSLKSRYSVDYLPKCLPITFYKILNIFSNLIEAHPNELFSQCHMLEQFLISEDISGFNKNLKISGALKVSFEDLL